MDKPGFQNYEECQRYFAKSFSYGALPATGSTDPQNTSRQGEIAYEWANQLRCAEAFRKPLAKLPTVNIWHPNGVANSVSGPGINLTVSSVISSTETIEVLMLAASYGFSGANQMVLGFYQYAADTGW